MIVRRRKCERSQVIYRTLDKKTKKRQGKYERKKKNEKKAKLKRTFFTFRFMLWKNDSKQYEEKYKENTKGKEANLRCLVNVIRIITTHNLKWSETW